MNTRIVAVLAIVALALVACGTSAGAEDTGVVEQGRVSADVEALAQQVLVLEAQVQKLQAQVDGVPAWESLSACETALIGMAMLDDDGGPLVSRDSKSRVRLHMVIEDGTFTFNPVRVCDRLWKRQPMDPMTDLIYAETLEMNQNDRISCVINGGRYC